MQHPFTVFTVYWLTLMFAAFMFFHWLQGNADTFYLWIAIINGFTAFVDANILLRISGTRPFINY